MQQTPKQIQEEQRSMMGAMVLVIAILFGFQYLFKQPNQDQQLQEITSETVVAEQIQNEKIPLKNTSKDGKHIDLLSDALSGKFKDQHVFCFLEVLYHLHIS